MSVTESLTTYGRQTVVGSGGARGNSGGRGRGGRGGGLGIGGGNGGRGGGSELWTPALAGAFAWWDGGTTSARVITGSGVSQLTDLTGNGRHLTQGTDSQRPTVAAASVNGLDTIQFNATGPKRLQAAAGVFNFLHQSGNGGYIMFVVRNEQSGSPGFVFVSGGTSGAGIQAAINVGSFNTLPGRIYNSSGFTVAEANIATVGSGVSNTAIIGIKYQGGASPNSDRVKLRFFDGAEVGNNVSGSAPTTGNSLTPLTIGADGFGNFPLVAKFCEALVWNTQPSTDIRNRSAGYLAHRWGITAGLGAGHPYKNNPPNV